MRKAERVQNIVKILDEHYAWEDKCYLNHTNPHELLIATILSAQCTDDRVNLITKDLFEKYKTIQDFASADIVEMEQDVRQTGFFRNKAKNIILSMRKLLTEYDGEMPSSIENLTSFAGVGRKTANVVRSHIFNIPSVVVDTHVMRISNKWGLVKSNDPVKIEFEIMKMLPKDHWIRYNTQVIAHGRAICTARSPKCEICFFKEYCKAYEQNYKKQIKTKNK